MPITSRRHGWQRPLHPLQIVGISIYAFLVVAFYCFLGLFLGNRTAEITVTAIFSSVVLSVMFLFIRCTAIDPTDKTSFRKKKKKKQVSSNDLSKLKYGFLLRQIILRFVKRMERKILRTFIRRKYLDAWQISNHMEPLLPFPLVFEDDAIASDLNEDDDIMFCTFCGVEVKKHSKHCRTCNRCVEGFDHHCRWLNNCIGKKNYTSFILLMIFVLLMLLLEGGAAVAIFVRCFADKNGIEWELKRRLYVKFPSAVAATISVFLVLLTAYGSAALGQLFFFHVILIRKGMKTYDYILAMKEKHAMEADAFDYSEFSSSDDSTDSDSSDQPMFTSQSMAKGDIHQSSQSLSLRIDLESEPASRLTKKQDFRVSIDPWKLIKMSRDKALLAAQKAREKLVKQNATEVEHEPLKPLPLETKIGLVNLNRSMANLGLGLTPEISSGRFPGGSSGHFSSPRRRFSGSPTTMVGAAVASPRHKYRSDVDLKLMNVSKELQTYISRPVLCSVLKHDENE